ncbi:MAG: shikimate dehydrogenase [Balneolaceae bacterium]|nr:shikimate dehydrogenase [Balneolaceae bacterium]
MVYSFDELKKSDLVEKPHYLVIGNPIRHSLSPVMHQYGLDYHGINAEYHALELYMQDLTGFVAWMNQKSFLGCNITIPYKQEFISLLDETDDSVKYTGAVNTISSSKDRITGFNTDVEGFLKPLYEHKDILYGNRAVVFGTGGASKAVIAGLIEMGLGEIVLVSRHPDKITYLLPDDSDFFNEILITPCSYDQLYAYAEEAFLFVNATPLGMAPNVKTSPIEKIDPQVLDGKICYDLVYNPLETEFLKTAKSQNAVIINGLDMFIAQGNRSFQIWTGQSLPHDEIYDLLTNILSDN